MQTKKILFITCEFYWGGAQKSFLKVVDAISSQYDSYIAVFDAGETKDYNGIPIFSLDRSKKRSKAGRLISRISRLKKIKKDLGITHSISFMEGADNLNILSRTGQEKVITSIRASIQFNEEYDDSLSNRIRKKTLMPFLYKKSDWIVTVSKDIKSEIVKYFNLNGDKIVPIYNFYDAQKYAELKEEEIEPEMQDVFSRFETIIGVGRLNKQKNFIGLVHIFSLVKKENENVKLIIIGTGEEHDLLMDVCKQLGLYCYSFQHGKVASYLDYDIILLGYRDNPHKYVCHSTLFVLPSKWEGFPNALAEAMLVGAPVLAADCPTGPSEILQNDQYGLLLPVPVNDADFMLWKDKIIALLDNKSELDKMGEKALERMKEFSGEQIIPQWFNLISE